MGRRWGKSVLGGVLSLSVAGAGGKVAWVVPTYMNGRPLWRWVMQFVGPLKAGKFVRTNISDRTVEFTNGGLLAIYSADNEDSIRGEWFHLVVVDEAGVVSETAWQEAIQPTLADADGDAILIGTPKGRNWFWNEYQRGLADGVHQAAFHAPSSDNPSPQIRRAFSLAKERLPERKFRQEWLAEFVDDSGGVFRRITEAATAVRQDKALAEHQYIAGVDVADQVDFTVVSVIDVTTGELCYLDRFNRVGYPVLEDRLAALYGRFMPSKLVIESNSIGQPVIDHLRGRGIPVTPFRTTGGTKEPVIQGLQAAFEHGRLKILNDPVLIGELQAFEAKRTASGGFKYSAPDGLHDDCVMSLALAWDAASTGPGWTDWAQSRMAVMAEAKKEAGRNG
jgi:hypothetical protein